MERNGEHRAYGLTGIVGKDGLLSLEQQAKLDALQTETAEACMVALEKIQPGDKYPLVAMATGIGKGKIIHEVIRRQKTLKPDSKILVIAGTKVVLVHQTQDALTGYQQNGSNLTLVESEESEEANSETEDVDETLENAEEFQGYSVGKYGEKDKDVEVATIQTVQSKLSRGQLNPDDYDLVVVDEVHNIGTRKRFDAVQVFPRAVGFTATPYRYSGQMKNPADYGFAVIRSLPLPEAQEQGFLPPLYALQINTSDIVEKIPTTLTGKIDYTALEKLLKDNPKLRPYIADRITPIITYEGKSYKTVVVVNFVWEAQELAELLKSKGIKVGVAVNQQAARAIHNEEIPAIDTIRRYKLLEDDPESIQVLISPYVASEGFDAPQTEMLVWASPTDSHLRYTQYTGRLARRAGGKAHGIVIDCLYQTRQYGWTYNFGMWMKGNVQQLENGLLYLGPIQEIKSMATLYQMKNLSDSSKLDDIQTTPLERLTDEDFLITQKTLLSLFVGHSTKLMQAVSEIITEISTSEPNKFVRKLNAGNKVVWTTRQPQLLIESMQRKGVVLKNESTDSLPIQPFDFPLTQHALLPVFVGDSGKLKEAAAIVVSKIKAENPGLCAMRRSGVQFVPVVTDRGRFISEMLAQGIFLKDEDLPQVEEGDFVLSTRSFKKLFRGFVADTLSLARQLLPELLSVDNRVLVQKRAGNLPSIVIINPELLFKLMVEKGAQLLPQQVQGDEFVISNNAFREIFVGEYKRLLPIAESVIDRIRQAEPRLIAERMAGTNYVRVVTDRSRFIQEMVNAGVQLKEVDILPPQETDFLLGVSYCTDQFVGTWSEGSPLKTILTRVVKEAREVYPERFTRRKSGVKIIDAFTDRDLFISLMIKNGAFIKESKPSPLQTNTSRIQETDLLLGYNSYSKIFQGGHSPDSKLAKLANQLALDLRKRLPNMFTIRQSGVHRVEVFTDRAMFIREMLARGARLKEKYNPIN